MTTLSANPSVKSQKHFARHALKAQGLLSREAFGRGINATRRAIEHLGYIQIDTISVVARAHHHSLWSRVPNYQPTHLNRLLNKGQIFEYWYHAAAFIPMRDYRFALPRMDTYRSGDTPWVRSKDRKLMQRVLARISAEGPLRARDFEDAAPGSSGWWNWKPAKRALEQLFMQGDLMISRRQGFQKVYDLRERVLPAGVDVSTPTTETYADYLIDTTLRAHGLARQQAFAYQRRGKPLRQAIERIIRQRLQDQSLIRIGLDEGSNYFADPEIVAAKLPRAEPRLRLLSPFDNAVILRDRTILLHGFDYQLECYVPAAKRRFGYFCLPLLYGDTFVGRADCKAHRRAQPRGTLELKHLHLERPWDPKTGASLPQTFLQALHQGVSDFARFNGCNRISIGEVSIERTALNSRGKAWGKSLADSIRTLF